MAFNSGASLGEARGRIVVDVSSVEQAAQMVKRYAEQMKDTLAGIGGGTSTRSSGATRTVDEITAAFQQAQREIQRAQAEIQSTTNKFQTVRIGANVDLSEVEGLQKAFQRARQPVQDARLALAQMREEAGRLGRNASLDMFSSDLARISRLTGETTAEMRGLSSEVDAFGSRAQQAATGARGYFARLRSELERINEQGLGRNLQELGFSFAPLSAGAGAAAFQGINRALDLEEVRLGFEAITSSQQEATALFEDLRREAQRFGLPVIDTLNAMQRLAPVVRQTGGDIRDFVGLAARLASINPTQGVEGAVIAISEALSGSGNDFVSLTERFNISRAALRNAVESTGSIQAGIDQVLNTYGRTEEVALRFGETGRASFRRFADAVSNFLAVALTPLLDVLTSVANGVTNFLNGVNNLSPALAILTSGFLGVTAVAAPLLLVVGNLVTAFEALRAAQIAGTLGRGALGIGALAAGGVAGVGISQFLADRGIGDQRLRSDSGEDPGAVIWERFRQAVVVIVDGLLQAGTSLTSAILELQLRFEYAFYGLIEGVAQATAELLRMVGLQDAADSAAGIAKLSGYQQSFRGAQLRFIESGELQTQVLDAARDAIVRPLTDFLFPELRQMESEANPLASSLQSAVSEIRLSFSTLVGSLRDAASKIAEVTEQFNQQQSRISAERALSAARSIEDMAIKRTRDIEAFNRALSDFDASAITEASEALSNLNESLANIEQEASRRRLEMTRSYEQERERSEEDHLNRLAEIRRQAQFDIEDAAAKLDAAGVFSAQRQRDEQIRREEDQFSIQSQRRQEDYQQQLVDLNASIAQQRAERIAEYQQQRAEQQNQYQQQRLRMIDDFNRRIQMEDADRALRLQRLTEDNAIADRYRQEDLNRRIAQIMKESNLSNQVTSLISTTLAQGRRVVSEALSTYSAMVSSVASAASQISRGGGAAGSRGSATPNAYQTGASYVPGGLAQLHAGEAVMNPTTAAMARSLLGQNYTQPQLRQALSGGGSTSISMPITVNAQGGNAVEVGEEVARAVNNVLMQLFNT